MECHPVHLDRQTRFSKRDVENCNQFARVPQGEVRLPARQACAAKQTMEKSFGFGSGAVADHSGKLAQQRVADPTGLGTDSALEVGLDEPLPLNRPVCQLSRSTRTQAPDVVEQGLGPCSDGKAVTGGSGPREEVDPVGADLGVTPSVRRPRDDQLDSSRSFSSPPQVRGGGEPEHTVESEHRDP